MSVAATSRTGIGSEPAGRKVQDASAVEVWADVICPWCLIGLTQLERALSRRDDPHGVRLRPLRLHPAWPAEGYDWPTFKAVRSLPDSIFHQVAEAGLREGSAFDFGAIVRVPDTLPLHRLLLSAGGPDEALLLYRAFARAYFHEGANLAEAATVGTVAVAAGLAPSTIARAFGDPSLANAVEASEREARSLGAYGVPFFRFAPDILAYGAIGTDELARRLDDSRPAAKP